MISWIEGSSPGWLFDLEQGLERTVGMMRMAQMMAGLVETTAQRKIEMMWTTRISVGMEGLTGWMDGWMGVKMRLTC